MPLFYINDDLVQEELRGEFCWEKDGNRDPYKRMMIKTAGGAVKRNEDGTSFSGIDRIICTHNFSTNTAARTRVMSTLADGDNFPKITVRTSMDTKYDTDVFVIAIPYEGLVMPVEPGNDLSVYRFMIMKSDQASIEHEGKKYRRCLYLVAAPKHSEKGADGWYGESCDLVVKTIQSNKPRNATENDGTWIWKITETRVRFGDFGAFDISTETTEAPYDTIDPDSLRDAKLCPCVEPTKVAARNNSGNGRGANTMGAAFKNAQHSERNAKNGNRGKKNGNRR